MRNRILLLVLTLFLANPLASQPSPPSASSPAGPFPLPDNLQTFDVSPQVRIHLGDDYSLYLEVLKEQGESLEDFARRTLAEPSHWEILRNFNPTITSQEAEDEEVYIRIPYEKLQEPYKFLTIARLFPEDSLQGDMWVHRVGSGKIPVAAESLWHLARWLTGDGRNFQVLAEINSIRDLTPISGQVIRIPATLLLPIFATPVSTEEGDLRFGTDEKGKYAAYQLKRGEAIYSSVVIRFTGLLDSDDVNQMAGLVVERSGIRDVTDLAVGYEVKIPRQHVLPQFLPRSDVRRIEHELSKRAVARFRKRTVSRHLVGVTVILDPGHGGRDTGAAHNGVWESDYVYDVMCRIKERLETETAARVLTTVKDAQYGYRIFESRHLSKNQAELVLTTPPFSLSSASATGVGVNLRWYLSNSHYRKLRKQGVDSAKIVFASLHADSLHPSLRGSMLYVPGEQYRRKRYGFSGPAYRKRKEVREQPYVSFTRKERQRAEGLSREFASEVIKALEKRKVRVHPYLPVRDHVIRKRRSWVPAVLRCNEVSIQVLFEVCNINNRQDAKLLADPRFRQRVADAFVDALLGYYA